MKADRAEALETWVDSALSSLQDLQQKGTLTLSVLCDAQQQILFQNIRKYIADIRSLMATMKYKKNFFLRRPSVSDMFMRLDSLGTKCDIIISVMKKKEEEK